MARQTVLSGVLVLAPERGGAGWSVMEVDAEAYETLAVVDGDYLPDREMPTYDTRGQALGAAYDVLTLLVEGRMPAMHEHVQESVRDFVRTLEARGYDRQSAVKILLDMVDRRASDPPKGARSRGSRRTRRD